MNASSKSSIRAQLKNNMVALISMALALISLGYNTWRNEQTEYNRNTRFAAFEIIIKLNELQRVVFFRHYERDNSAGNPHSGWTSALAVRDMAQLIPETMPVCTAHLITSWEENWAALGENNIAVKTIDQAIDNCRDTTLKVLHNLR